MVIELEHVGQSQGHGPFHEFLADLGTREHRDRSLDEFVPTEAMGIAEALGQKAIPAIAQDKDLSHRIGLSIALLPTRHRLVQADSRDFLRTLPDESVHLVLTSPPYWTLKQYPDQTAQLGGIEDYEAFLAALNEVWQETYRLLVPGGRLIVVVGDVCLPRRVNGRHVVFPLHASIQEHCRRLGYDNLAPIIWYKIANAQFEAEPGSHFLGKPYEPNAVVKNDIEFILFQRKPGLFQRKPGGYRSPSLLARLLSVIPEALHHEWFQQIWTVGGASTRNHPAPYPLALAERLVRMFSFVGDTVLDPFMGSGTTSLAAGRWGRNSIGVEVDEGYFSLSCDRMAAPASRPLKNG